MSSFYEEQLEQSKIKSEIVCKYFDAWSKIIANRSNKIGYIDLYSGKGEYDDGTESTPIRIMKKIINSDKLIDKTITLFNDMNTKYIKKLEKKVNKLEGIERLRYKPLFYNKVINKKFNPFSETKLIPTLSFLDPWGYKGIHYDLINSLVRSWGCDLIFFFNYNRINMGLSNPKVEKHMNALFKPDVANKLRKSIESLNPVEREEIIINTLEKESPTKHSKSFQFIDENRNRTSHYLLFLTNNSTGLHIMKDIMSKLSTKHLDGVPKYTYHPRDDKIKQLPLIITNKPFEELKNSLIKDFTGQEITFNNLFFEHHVKNDCTRKNYKDAILELESDGLIECKPAFNERRPYKGKPSLPDSTLISFP